MTELIGANNNHVRQVRRNRGQSIQIPSHAGQHVKGCFGAAEGGPIETGKFRRAIRTRSAFVPINCFDLGPAAEKYTVKMSTPLCPIRCMTQMNIPRVKEFYVPSTGGNTCSNFVHTTIFPNGPKDFEDKDDGRADW